MTLRDVQPSVKKNIRTVIAEIFEKLPIEPCRQDLERAGIDPEQEIRTARFFGHRHCRLRRKGHIPKIAFVRVRVRYKQ